jgi:hypothetical protein
MYAYSRPYLKLNLLHSTHTYKMKLLLIIYLYLYLYLYLYSYLYLYYIILYYIKMYVYIYKYIYIYICLYMYIPLAFKEDGMYSKNKKDYTSKDTNSFFTNPCCQHPSTKDCHSCTNCVTDTST